MEWTDESIGELVGTAWAGKGGIRRVASIHNPSVVPGKPWFRGDVIWSRGDGALPRKTPLWGPYFVEWWKTATPANEAAEAWLQKWKEPI